jgi:endonuclease YncB( thermonuclease family)
MHSKIRRKTVAVRPSRIRREPVRLQNIAPPLSKAELEKAVARSRKLEVWGGVGGVLLFGAGLAVAIVGISAATIFRDSDPAAAAQAARFVQCYSTDGSNCVLDGGTVYVAGEKVAIAGIEAPQIQDAQCDDERNRGIGAAVRLADLLNSGKVTVSRSFRDSYGRDVRKVKVNGEDVGAAMIDAGVAREYDGKQPDWCDAADEG